MRASKSGLAQGSGAPRRSQFSPLALVLLGLTGGCESGGRALDDGGTSLYASVAGIDGVYFYPPLGPEPAPQGAFDATLLDGLSVALEAVATDGAVTPLALFDQSTTPRVSLLGERERYFVDIPAATYVTEPAKTYRVRVLLDGSELGASVLSPHVFTVLAYHPELPIGVHVRIEGSGAVRAVPRDRRSGGGRSAAHCSDGVRNKDETGVDCGGSCAPCGPDCSTRIPVAPLYGWGNTIGHSGDGFGSEGAAEAAGVADSLANDTDGQCTVNPARGSFPSWSLLLAGCSDVSVSAYCPPNAVMDVQREVCLVSPCTPCIPSAEVCDGVDNDCDGQIDEGTGGGACSTGLPGACGAGVEQCVSGGVVCTELHAPTAEVCDGVDDDCDGVADDGNPGGGLACSTGLLGVCAAGVTSCSGGRIVCDGTTAPSAEVCGNALDDDCDGQVDEGCPTCTDGVRNQGETGIDCGGPCTPCPAPLAGGAVAGVRHASANGEGNRDGSSYPLSNLFDGRTDTKTRYRTGSSQGFTIDLALAGRPTIDGLRIFVPPGQNAGYAGIRISTSDGTGFVVRYTNTGLFGITGRNASSAYVGGGSFGGGVVGGQGWADHLFSAPVANVSDIRIETGMNDEASDACYSMNELVILGH